MTAEFNEAIWSFLRIEKRLDSTIYRACLDIYDRFGLCSLPLAERESILCYMNEVVFKNIKEEFNSEKKYIQAQFYTRGDMDEKAISRLCYMCSREEATPLDDTFLHIGNICDLYSASLIIFDDTTANSKFAEIISKIKPTILLRGREIIEMR